jgi:hypothetical protein
MNKLACLILIRPEKYVFFFLINLQATYKTQMNPNTHKNYFI